MVQHKHRRRHHPLWWTAGMFAFVCTVALVCSGFFTGTFTSSVPITVVSDRTGLVMESGAKVKMRGVEVGRVAGVNGGGHVTNLKVDIFPDQLRHIPANVQAEIEATTLFGSKYVNLITPDHPSPKPLAANAVVHSRNVSIEVNTVFENLVHLLNKIDVSKLNSVLTALAEGVGGQGERIGQATTDANEVLLAINPRMGVIAQNWRSFKGFNDAYAQAARDILSTLNAATTTSVTVTKHAKDLDALLLSTAGFANSGIGLLGPNKSNLINAINGAAPTLDLLFKYNPVLTCTIVGAQFFLQHDGYKTIAGNGKSIIGDAALLFGEDPYRYPDNLPIVAAKGGPGGKPGCGSLPDVAKNFPVQYQVTNTGWGTGLDMRPNPGIGFPGWMNFFPGTRGTPEPPSIRYFGGPAPGPVPYAGAPPYGGPLYGPDGSPLYPGLPPAPSTPPTTDAPAPTGAP